MTLGDFINQCIAEGANLDTPIGYRDMNFGGIDSTLSKDDVAFLQTKNCGNFILLQSRYFEELD